MIQPNVEWIVMVWSAKQSKFNAIETASIVSHHVPFSRPNGIGEMKLLNLKFFFTFLFSSELIRKKKYFLRELIQSRTQRFQNTVFYRLYNGIVTQSRIQM